MIRSSITKKIQNSNKEFRLRGHEVKRIEAFSDAVFAFAVTLLIVSLEVPKTFEDLLITMRGFFAFGISFSLLMMIWYEQNVFFRRYAMDDITIITLNCILIFLVLFFVYPLKFLFTFIFSPIMYAKKNFPIHVSEKDPPMLLLIYGSGYIAIYLLFCLMYVHAFRKRKELELTVHEQFDTKTKMFANSILVSVGVVSVVLSQLLPQNLIGLAGFSYFLIWPAFTVFYIYRTRKRKLLIDNISESQ
ncbi:MAG: TMEM175 family protein [Chitinophagaceae bacterium]